MLKKIFIQNFQSHEETMIEFQEGVNTIIGESDVGKTAILRALYWAVFNRPLGDSFSSNWEHEGTYVQLYTENGVITRVKTANENYYQLDRKTFKAMGNTVPDEIQNALNMQSINFSLQMDPPFFLSMSPGVRATYLNRCVNLDIIDQSMSKANSLLREESRRIQDLELSANALKEEFQHYNNVPSLFAKCKQADHLHEKYNQLDSDIKTFKKRIQQYLDSKEVLVQKKNVSGIQIDKAKRIAGNIKSLMKKIEDMSMVISEYKYIEERKITIASKLERLKKEKDALPITYCSKCGQPIVQRRRRK